MPTSYIIGDKKYILCNEMCLLCNMHVIITAWIASTKYSIYELLAIVVIAITVI